MSTVSLLYDSWAARVPTDQARLIAYHETCAILRRRLEGNTESTRTFLQLHTDVREAWDAMSTTQRFALKQPADVFSAVRTLLESG